MNVGMQLLVSKKFNVVISSRGNDAGMPVVNPAEGEGMAAVAQVTFLAEKLPVATHFRRPRALGEGRDTSRAAAVPCSQIQPAGARMGDVEAGL